MIQTFSLLEGNYRSAAILLYSLLVIRASSLHHRTSEVDPSHWLWRREPQGPNPSGVNSWHGWLFNSNPPRETDVKVTAGTRRAPPIIAGLLEERAQK